MAATTKTTAAPTLNSYPVATATIYLDFDGHDVNSSMWNYGTPFICSPVTMTDAQITDAFNRVAEDFRPFNINVTTDLSKFLAAPLSQRIRVIITPSSAWYPSVAGIAYVTSFTWGDDTPCFVFSDRLSNDGKRVAEAISHETGHTLGLYHQSSYTTTCTLTSAYHTGIGTGSTSWGPIMGNVASKNLTQWNFGPTPNGCSFLQDNLSIITTTNGFGYRPDDFGDLYTTANVMTVTSNLFSKAGVISTSIDKDIFRFDLGQLGKFTMNVDPYSVGAAFSGANLDVKIELKDSKGITIKTYDIIDSVNARIDTTLTAGTYYVVVDGAGSVNNVNDYGSLGSYSITGYYSGTTTTTTTTTTTKTRTKGGRTSTNLISAGNESTEAISAFKVIKQAQQAVLVNATQAYEYQVVDNYGRIIMNGKAAAGTKTIDIRNQPAGVYNLKLMNSTEQKVEKFING
jgi:hypothetical protein